MFAFAIWDARNERLFLARDRFGEKPLFLHEEQGGLYFASEIKALLRVPGIAASVDLRAVWDYLAYRYVPGPQNAVHRHPQADARDPSHVGARQLSEGRYWSAPDRMPRAPPRSPPSDAVEGFLQRLDEAVQAADGERRAVRRVPLGRHSTPRPSSP